MSIDIHYTEVAPNGLSFFSKLKNKEKNIREYLPYKKNF